MNLMNYYKILEIEYLANNEEIKRAYRKKTMIYHPDKNNSINAHEEFILIKTAYDVLSDENKRKEYDNLIKLRTSPHVTTSSIETDNTTDFSYSKHMSSIRDNLKIRQIIFEAILYIIISIVILKKLL